MSDSVRPHRQQPTRLPRPWDSLGKNTGVGSPTCLFLLVLPWLLGSYLKHYCQGHCQGGHLLCFILGHLWFQVLCSSLPSSLSWFCVRYKIQVQFHSSARGCAVFLTHLLKRLSFPTFEYSIFLFLCNLFSPHSL